MVGHDKRCAVVALGGNAIWPSNELGTVADQFRHTRESLKGICDILRRQYLLAVTHGNGPQVGASLRRVELAKHELPDVPLGVLVAETQGSMGYMIEQSMQNLLANEQIHRTVATVVTQILVDADDPALSNPTKYIGRHYNSKQAEQFMRQNGWSMKQVPNAETWRRVVGSPKPISIVNSEIITQLVYSGTIVITAGGGGIPVHRDPELGFEGTDAVIDKDMASAVLARDIDADEFFLLTDTDYVYLNFGRSSQRKIEELTLSKAKDLLNEGHFPAGSMGPKVQAAVNFLESGGECAYICALERIEEALNGKSGTKFIP